MRRKLAGMLILLLMVLAMPLAEARTPVSASEQGVPPRRLSLEIDGVRLDGVLLAGALTVTRPLVDSSCSGDGLCTRDLHLAVDSLERAAAGIEESARHEAAMNAIRNLKGLAVALDTTLGIGDLDGDGALDRTYRPGRPVFGNITFERDLSGDKSLATWFSEAASGKNIRKSVTVVLKDQAGKEVARYNLFECWPVAYKISKADAGLVERLELYVERVERAPISVGEEGVNRAAGTVLLEADGERLGSFELASGLDSSIIRGGGDCDDLNACTGGVDDDCDGLDACTAGVPVRCADGACTAEALAALAALEEQVAGLADRSRHDTVKNAIGNIRARLAEVETQLQGAYRSGKAKYKNIVLKRGVTGQTSAAGWITAEAKGWRKSISIIFIGRDGEEVARFSMQGGLVRYSLTGGEQMVEELEFAVEKVERN